MKLKFLRTTGIYLIILYVISTIIFILLSSQIMIESVDKFHKIDYTSDDFFGPLLFLTSLLFPVFYYLKYSGENISKLIKASIYLIYISTISVILSIVYVFLIIKAEGMEAGIMVALVAIPSMIIYIAALLLIFYERFFRKPSY